MWLHRYAVLLACCTLFLVVAGALVTSHEAGLSVPDWPLSYGKLMPEMEGGIFYEHGHRMIATTVGFLTIILAVWLWRAEPRPWLKKLGWAALGAVIFQGLLGGMTVIFMLPKPVSVSHACLAQLFFSTIVAISWFTSAAWRRGGTLVEDQGAPGLRSLAVAASGSLFLQLALGAATRHKAFGVTPHVLGAVLATGMVLWLIVRILLRHGNHQGLVRPALALLAITFSQVFLGVAAYMSRLATADAPQPMPVMIGFTVVHVAVGALTLATSVIVAIQVFRFVQPEPAVSGARVPVAS
ncbi:MAG: COX15/CtaA family protein [Bryobacterales bacterium]|nr:COX15/CtaA family protein [Bryobacterales bacterium]